MGIGFWLLVAAAGAVGQFIDAVSGMGFGAFSASVMLAGGIAPAVVVATVNIAKIGSGAASAASHWKFGNVRRQWIVPLAVSGIAGGVLGALLLTSGLGDFFGRWMPWILLGIAFLILRRFLFPSATLPLPRISGGAEDSVPASVSQERARYGVSGPAWFRKTWIRAGFIKWVRLQPDTFGLAVIGFGAGLINALSGAYGPFATSAVMLTKQTPPRFAVGTVNFVEVAVAGAVSVTLLMRADLSQMSWQMPLALIAGAVVTAPLGAYLTRRLPAKTIGIAVAVTMIALNVTSLVRR